MRAMDYSASGFKCAAGQGAMGPAGIAINFTV
jgi:hypothetical protein